MIIYFVDEDQKVLRRAKRVKDTECSNAIDKIVEEELLDMLSYISSNYAKSSLINVSTPTDIFVTNTYYTVEHNCVVCFRVI